LKDRKTILLVVLVSGIWGTIGFKIFRQMDDDGPVTRAVPRHLVRDTVVEERLHLSLAYDDPFLKTPPKKVALPPSVKKVQIQKPKPAPPVVTVNWERVKYMGNVYNGTRGKLLATVKLDNVEYLLKEGQAFEGFTLLKIHRDSVMIGYEKSKKYIKRE
jgi:hypothetical protein